MSSEHMFEQKGKVQPKPAEEAAEPQKDSNPVTKAEAESKLDPSTLTRMQKTVGNAAVQRFLAQRQGSGPSEVDDGTAEAIRKKRGSGSSLDEGIAGKAGGVMGQDFSGVNVHTDSQADTLSRSLGAKAFTTGNDIFFQSGAYNPGSSEGQRLISHELTHVVQQGASPATVQGKMTVNDPNDQYEGQADKVADMVMNAPDEAAVQRAEAPEDEMELKPDPNLQRQVEKEPEEGIQEKADPTLQREGEEEEKLLQGKVDPDLQRQEDEELETKLDPNLQRQEDEEIV